MPIKKHSVRYKIKDIVPVDELIKKLNDNGIILIEPDMNQYGVLISTIGNFIYIQPHVSSNQEYKNMVNKIKPIIKNSDNIIIGAPIIGF